MPNIETSRGRVWYTDVGNGRPAILIPGLAGVASYWDPQLALSSRSRLISYDHAGLGRSERFDGPCSIEELAADLVALIKALDFAEVDLVGHSTGGCIALVASTVIPERVRKLILVSSWLEVDYRFLTMLAVRRFLIERGTPLDFIRSGLLFNYPPDWLSARGADFADRETGLAASVPSADLVCARIDALAAFSGRAYVDRLPVRPVVACAADDQVTPLQMSRVIAREACDGEITVFSEGGHCVTQTNPEEFNGFLTRALSHPGQATP